MQSKKKFGVIAVLAGALLMSRAYADEDILDVSLDVDMENISADAVADYQVDGSLFQQITDLEQEKVLMQLEKERAQLDLELDRLAAEKIKLHMEIDTLSGRQEQQQQELETEKAKLEAEAARLVREKEKLEAEAAQEVEYKSYSAQSDTENASIDISKKYRLVNVIGAGSQLQATIEDLATGQSKRIAVGKKMDGLTVKSISFDDGVLFVDGDGVAQYLNVSSGK